MRIAINLFLVITIVYGGGMWITRWLSGWGKLEALYKCSKAACKRQISRGSYRWVRATFRFSDLGIGIELYPEFLWLSMGFPHTLVLKTLCIPWDAIEDVQMKKFLLFKRAHLRIKGCPFVVRISGEAGLKIFEMTNSFRISA